MEEEEIYYFIKDLFDGYKNRKKENRLYSSDDYLPQNLICAYFKHTKKANFKHIVYNFKRRYVYNENELENVHDKSERQGLGVVYDYIQNGEYSNMSNIYVILKLHSLLYSKVPYPEFGGSFRSASACISDSDVKTVEPLEISKEISKLYTVYSALILLGNKVKEKKDTNLLMYYIDRCIELKCRIVEIHPFTDGNGRTSRALLNLLFREIDLPPVYVRNKEKTEYITAMDTAIRLKDTNRIKRFYYYKICDSIVELDINERILKEEEDYKKFKMERKNSTLC